MVQGRRHGDGPGPAADGKGVPRVPGGDGVGHRVLRIRVSGRYRAHRVGHGGVLRDLEGVGVLVELRGVVLVGDGDGHLDG